MRHATHARMALDFWTGVPVGLVALVGLPHVMLWPGRNFEAGLTNGEIAWTMTMVGESGSGFRRLGNLHISVLSEPSQSTVKPMGNTRKVHTRSE